MELGGAIELLMTLKLEDVWRSEWNELRNSDNADKNTMVDLRTLSLFLC
jgi:hypothetical protein